MKGKATRVVSAFCLPPLDRGSFFHHLEGQGIVKWKHVTTSNVVLVRGIDGSMKIGQ